MINNIYKLIMWIAVALGVGLITYAGIQMIINSATPGKSLAARGLILQTLGALAIVFGSTLIVNETFRALAGSQANPSGVFQSFTCTSTSPNLGGEGLKKVTGGKVNLNKPEPGGGGNDGGGGGGGGTAGSPSSLPSGGQIDNDAGRTLKAKLDANSQRYNQFSPTNPVGGSAGCARSTRLLKDEAGVGREKGDIGIPPSGYGKVPSKSDFSPWKKTLDSGDLIWAHVTGQGSGQHWIIIMGMKETQKGYDITFMDPADGTIKHAPSDYRGDGVRPYFGATPLGGSDSRTWGVKIGK